MSCCGKAVEVLAHGAVGIASSVLPFSAKATPHVRYARREICRVCEHSGKTVAGKLTNLSGCALCHCNIMLKTRLAAQSCPAEPAKW